MRADSHYVDQLTTRRADVAADAPRIAKRAEPAELADAPAETRNRREPREVRDVRDAPHDAPRDAPREDREAHDGRDAQSERLLDQLLSDIGTIGASAELLAGPASALARRANVDAVRAHAWRASWLLRAHALVEGLHRGQQKVRPIAPILAHVREGFAAESRLSGLDIQVQAADWNATVAADEVALITGLTGAVVATLALLPDPAGSTIKISATTLGSELRALEISQDELVVPATVSSVFFDPLWGERPGGWIAALGAACLKTTAQLHRGDAVFMAGARRGSTVRLNLHRVS